MRVGYVRLNSDEDVCSSPKIAFVNCIDMDAVFTDYDKDSNGLKRMMHYLPIGSDLIVCNLEDGINDEQRRELQKCVLRKNVRLYEYDHEQGDILQKECRISNVGRKPKNLINQKFISLYNDWKTGIITKRQMAEQLNVCYATLEKQIVRYGSMIGTVLDDYRNRGAL